MVETVRGLVIRTVDYREADRLITVFTEEKGTLTALAKGARSMKSRSMAPTQLFCYSDFVLYKKGDMYWVREADLIESFFGLRSGIAELALASYIVDVLSLVTVGMSDVELLRVSLNSLYAIAERKYELTKIKAAFEMRAAAILGFMPDILECRNCGTRSGDFYLHVMGGFITCADCHAKEQVGLAPVAEDAHEASIIRFLSEGAKVALGYVIYAPPEKIFAFRISEEDMRIFGDAAECYLLNQLEKPFKTLDFYHEVTAKN